MLTPVHCVVIPQIKAMSEDIQPLLSEVRDTGLLKEVEGLTKSLTQATDDLRQAIIYLVSYQFKVISN